jgi:hypothetical protein
MRTLLPRLALAAGIAVITTSPAAAVAERADRGGVVDVPAPFFWDSQAHQRIGGDADRFELDDSPAADSLSAWYHLSYLVPSDRLQVHEHSPRSTSGPESDIAKSENVAWHVATTLLGGPGGLTRPGELPARARPRTGGADGTSAGALFALADLDLLTPGRLAAALRVAATGTIGSDGAVTAVRGVDAKLAAARLARADVVFSPDFPRGSGAVTTLTSHLGQALPRRTIGDWLNTAGYEAAGRAAARHSGDTALVQIDDVRQAVAWLCGRTGGTVPCAVAHAAAVVPLAQARPYVFPPSAGVPPPAPSTSQRSTGR